MLKGDGEEKLRIRGLRMLDDDGYGGLVDKSSFLLQVEKLRVLMSGMLACLTSGRVYKSNLLFCAR